jgi:hypothetical protein
VNSETHAGYAIIALRGDEIEVRIEPAAVPRERGPLADPEGIIAATLAAILEPVADT